MMKNLSNRKIWVRTAAVIILQIFVVSSIVPVPTGHSSRTGRGWMRPQSSADRELLNVREDSNIPDTDKPSQEPAEKHKTYDEIVLEEMARNQGVSIDDLEKDFERGIEVQKERLRFKGFISPEQSGIVQTVYNIHQRIVEQIQIQDSDFKSSLYFVDENMVNAFVFRNHTDVYFFKGYYETFLETAAKLGIPFTEDMIASVIAHELGHSIQHTSFQGLDIRDFQKDMPQYVIQMMKNAEYDADRKSLELMDKAGYSVFGAIDEFRCAEYISVGAQAESIDQSHPYVSIRKHRLTQIIFEQDTEIFPNAKKAQTPFPQAEKLPGKDPDFRGIIYSSEEELVELLNNAKDFDYAKGILFMLSTKKRMAIMKALKNAPAVRLAFAKRIYLDAAIFALYRYREEIEYNRYISLDVKRLDYKDLRQAASACEFGEDLDPSGVVIDLLDAKFSLNATILFNGMNNILKERMKVDAYGDEPEDIIKFVKKHLKFIERQYNKIDESFLDNLLREPESVKDIRGLFKSAESEFVDRAARMIDGKEEEMAEYIPDLDVIFSDPQALVSAYLYGYYLGQSAEYEVTDPTTNLKLTLQGNKNALYMQNPRYWDISDEQTRGKLLEVLIAHYLNEVPSGNILTDKFSYITDQYPGAGKYMGVSKETVDAVFLSLYKTLDPSYSQALKVLISKQLIKKYLGKEIYPVDLDKDLLENIILRNLPGAHFKKRTMKALISYYDINDANKSFYSEVQDFRALLFLKGADYGTFKKKLAEFIENNKYWKTLKKHEAITRRILNSIKQDFLNMLVPSNAEVFTACYLLGNPLGLTNGIASASPRNDIIDVKTFKSAYASQPKRSPNASGVFIYETGLNFMPEKVEWDSFEALEKLPAWCVSEIIDKDMREVDRNISYMLYKHPEEIERVLKFMQEKLSFADRRRFFENFLRVPKGFYSEYEFRDKGAGKLSSFFDEKFSNDHKQIILWFLGMFSKQDALGFLEKFVVQAEQMDSESRIAIFEYIYSQASPQFKPDHANVKIYLELIKEKYALDKTEDKEFVKEKVFDAMMILSGAVDLKIQLYSPNEVAYNGSNDFRSAHTSIGPGKGFENSLRGTRETLLSGHSFAWNDDKTLEQSSFVLSFADFSIEQLRKFLKARREWVKDQASLEYKGEKFVQPASEDFFAHFAELCILRKLYEGEEKNSRDTAQQINRLQSIMNTLVSYEQNLPPATVSYDKKREEEKIFVDTKLELGYSPKNINSIPANDFIESLSGCAVPSSSLDKIVEEYIEERRMYYRFPEFAEFLQHPNATMSYLTYAGEWLKKRADKSEEKISYRTVMAELIEGDSAYSRIFEVYCNERGEGVFYGKLLPVKDRLEKMKKILRHGSLLRDNMIDLWEARIFPEIVDDMPELLKFLSATKDGKDSSVKMWSLLKSVDDDVGKLRKIYSLTSLSRERYLELLEFYETVIPDVLSPQRRARYGATAYLLWKRLKENQHAPCSAHLGTLLKFMPEPSVLRDEMLMEIGNRHARTFKQIQTILPHLYSNNLLSSNRDLRSEDFVSETIVSLFSTAQRRDRKEILLWIQGERPKPEFVEKIEDKYKIIFDTLPMDMMFLPASIRDKFIESFMLGDNGLLDSGEDAEARQIMDEYLQAVFLHIFPEGSEGLEEDDRKILSDVFSIVMNAYYPYRRVHVIKTLAALRAQPDFRKISTGERLAALLGALGPVGIKVAQYLSENETIVSNPDLRSRLGALRNRAPEISKVSAFAALMNGTSGQGALVTELGDPLGIASMKQVNRGKWLDIESLEKNLRPILAALETEELDAKKEAYESGELPFDEFSGFLLDKAVECKIPLIECAQNVVYKILRPSLEASLKSDYEALDAVAHELEGAVHKGHIVNIKDLVETVKGWIELEKDFNNEVRFHNDISGLDYEYASEYEEKAGLKIKHPQILYYSKSLIVEEEVRGIALMELSPSAQEIRFDDLINAGYSKEEARERFEEFSNMEPRPARIYLGLKKAGFEEGAELDRALEKMLEYDYTSVIGLLRKVLLNQLFFDGVFHADLHQGNVMVTPEGGLYMIDRGNVGYLNVAQMGGAKSLLKGCLLRDKNMIKAGIDTVFKEADYADGQQSDVSEITLKDIQEILDKNFDMKTTMHMLTLKALEGGRSAQGAKDFSLFMKAFTQAMYLFPTDLKQGMETIAAIAEYVRFTDKEMKDAVAKQAQLIIFKQKEDTGDKDIFSVKKFERIMKSIVAEKTDTIFGHRLWRPFVMLGLNGFIAISRPFVGKGIAKGIAYGQANAVGIFGYILKELQSNPGADIVNLLKPHINRSNIENLLISNMEKKSGFFGGVRQGFGVRFLKFGLFIARPMVNLSIEVVLVWLNSDGKNMLEDLKAQMQSSGKGGILSGIFSKTNTESAQGKEAGEKIRVSIPSKIETVDIDSSI